MGEERPRPPTWVHRNKAQHKLARRILAVCAALLSFGVLDHVGVGCGPFLLTTFVMPDKRDQVAFAFKSFITVLQVLMIMLIAVVASDAVYEKPNIINDESIDSIKIISAKLSEILSLENISQSPIAWLYEHMRKIDDKISKLSLDTTDDSQIKSIQDSVKALRDEFNQREVSMEAMRFPAEFTETINSSLKLFDKVTSLLAKGEEGEKVTLMSAKKDLVTSIHTVAGQIRTLPSAIDRINSKVLKLNDNFEGLQKIVSSIKDKLDTLETSFDKLPSEGISQDMLKSYSDDIKRLNDEATALRTGLSELNDWAGNVEGRLKRDKDLKEHKAPTCKPSDPLIVEQIMQGKITSPSFNIKKALVTYCTQALYILSSLVVESNPTEEQRKAFTQEADFYKLVVTAACKIQELGLQLIEFKAILLTPTADTSKWPLLQVSKEGKFFFKAFNKNYKADRAAAAAGGGEGSGSSKPSKRDQPATPDNDAGADGVPNYLRTHT